MANPFFTPQNGAKQPQNQTNLENVVNAFSQMVSSGQNPQVIQQILISKNPKLKKLYVEMMQSGMSPLDYARNKAMQKNINITPALQQMLDMVNQKS